MLVTGMRRLCRVGLAAALVTALCVLTLVDMPLQLPELPTDLAPTTGSEPPGTRSIVAYSWARRLALDYRPSRECSTNETVSSPSLTNTSNQVEKTWLETIPGRLFLYSSHLDIRVVRYPSVRVIGVKREPAVSGVLFCTIWQEDHEGMRSFSMEALVSDIWLDEWGGTSTGYTGILITCPLPDSGTRPSRVFVGLTACYQNTSHSLIVKQVENVTRESEFTLCIKGLDFDEDISERLIAFFELSRILGASMFYVYVFNVHENVTKVLRLYEKSNVVRWFRFNLPGDLPNEVKARRRLFSKNIWMKRRMELIPYNHCFYDNLYSSEFIVPIDIDEMIIPINKRTWSEVLQSERKKAGKSFNDYASYAVRNVYFFPELQKQVINNRKAETIGNDSEFLNYFHTLRTSVVSPEGDSVKSFVSTERALTIHNHYALTTLNPSARRAYHLDPQEILKHHHRHCDSDFLDCNLMMRDVTIDESVLKYLNEFKARVKLTLTYFDAMM
ncbi:uncharacterized protein [Chelonus insularis]|uniref:uncharacterized protein isoform X2 n=1 Tax=Chelonus insularis TaxID=460826 RepID=UPI00158B8BDF|nr:uncharacterized protein LOC118066358 isoform X2 [Chelonus insularis]